MTTTPLFRALRISLAFLVAAGVSLAPAFAATAPGAPTITSVTPGINSVTVAFNPPSNDGGIPISGYQVYCSGNYVGGAASPITVSGLPGGAPVTCTVFAYNDIGPSAVSVPGPSATPLTPNATLYFQSQTGDYIGQGRTVNIGTGNGVIFSSNVATSISLGIGTVGGFWELVIEGPNSVRPVVGSYPIATRWPSQVAGAAGLSFYGEGRICNTASGNLQVLELVIDVNDNLTSLALNFEQHCGDLGAPALFGQLRFNSSVPIDTAKRHIQPIAFASAQNAAPNTLVTSNPALISGIDVAIPISISGGEYSINGGSFTSASGTVVNSQSVRVRLTSAPTGNTLTTAQLDIGGSLVAFRVGTEAGLTPQPNGDPLIVVVGHPKSFSATTTTKVYSPATFSNIQLSTATSPAHGYVVHREGYSYAQNASFAGPGNTRLAVGSYTNVKAQSTATTPFLYTSGEIECGYIYDAVTRLVVREVEYQPSGTLSKLAMDYVQFCAADSPYGQSIIYGFVRINSSLAIDYSMTHPVPFKFPFVADVATGTSVTSATATIAGINVPIPISVTGGEYSINGDAFTAAAGMISNGQSLRLRQTSAATANTMTTATVTLGELTVPFKVGTAVGQNPQPNNGSLVALTWYSSDVTAPIQTRIISPANGSAIRIYKDAYSNVFGPVTVSADYVVNGYNTNWNANMSGPGGGALAVGTYLDVTPAVSDTTARFYSYGGVDCSNSEAPRATLVVHEIEYQGDGTPSKLAADYVQRCSLGNANSSSFFPDHIGFIRVNSTVPISYAITLPAPFSFGNVINAIPGSQVLSNLALIRGITVSVPISVLGGEYRIDGGPFTSAAGVIMPGQSVEVRLSAAAQANTLAIASLTVGDRTSSFSVGSSATNAPQPNGAPLVVLVVANSTDGLTAPYVMSPATFASITPESPGYQFSYGGLQAYQNSNNWRLFASGPGRSALAPGSYIGATPDSSATTLPFFTINSYSSGTAPAIPSCYGTNGATITDFIVHEVEYAVSGLLLKLALDFHQRCPGNPAIAVVHGYVRFNSSVAIDYTVRNPVPMVFATVIGATPGASVESNEITVRGINVAVPISITGGEYSIDGGAYASTAGTIRSGQKLKLRAPASALFNAIAAAQVVVGEGSAEFKIGTVAGANPQPNGDALVFLISQSGDTLGQGTTYLYSPAAASTIMGGRYGSTATLDANAGPPAGYFFADFWRFSFTAPDGNLLVPGTYNMVAFSPTAPNIAGMAIMRNHYYPCSVISGQFTVHEISYSANGMNKLAIDFINYCSGYPGPLYGYLRFNSNVPVVAVVDNSPAQFWFTSQDQAALSTMITSTAITPNGFSVAAPISIVNGEYSIDNGPFTNASGMLSPGQSVRVRLMSSAQHGTMTTATVMIGGVAAQFNVTTVYADTNPSLFSFGFMANVPLSQWINSPVITPVGFNVPVVVTINGGEFSVGGRPFTSAPSGIQPGETIQVRLMSSTAFYDYRVSLLTIGGTTGQFAIQTVAQVDLGITVNGLGSVTSNPAGVACSSTCSAVFLYGTMVTLTASPAPGMQFTGWTGGSCSGVGTCTVTTNAAQTIAANFAAAPPSAPTIVSAVPGNGSATLSFTPVIVQGGLPFTSFTATCGVVSKSGSSSPITLTGLTNGTSYSCSVTATNSARTSPASVSVSVTPTAAAAPSLIAVRSRKVHGAAGEFDLRVKLNEPISGAVTVEPRAIGAGHMLVFQFDTEITAANHAIIDGSGNTITPTSVSFSGNEVRMVFATLADKTRMRAALSAVNDSLNVEATIGYLVGDVNATYSVDMADTSAVKLHAGQTVNADNFQFNIVSTGVITASDISVVKARSGNVLP